MNLPAQQRPAPELRVLPDAAALAAAVAEAFVELLERPVPEGRTPSVHEVALTGGTIARSIHRAVAEAAPGSAVPWGRVRFWWGDERFVAADDAERNAGQARADMLDALTALPGAWPAAVLEDRIMEVPALGEVASVEDSAELYSERLRSQGTGGFDLIMLGVGPDGHVASLFPGHAALGAEQIAIAVTDSPKPPPQRVSLTFGAMKRVEEVWFLVSGAEKAEAVRRALAPTGSVAETPARGVHGRARTIWWLDTAAASLL